MSGLGLEGYRSGLLALLAFEISSCCCQCYFGRETGTGRGMLKESEKKGNRRKYWGKAWVFMTFSLPALPTEERPKRP